MSCIRHCWNISMSKLGIIFFFFTLATTSACKKSETPNIRSSEEKITFIVSSACINDVEEKFSELAEFDYEASIETFNYSTGEFLGAEYVGSIYREGANYETLEVIVNGAIEDCWASSTAKFDTENDHSMNEFTRYIRLLNKVGADSIYLSINEGEILSLIHI